VDGLARPGGAAASGVTAAPRATPHRGHLGGCAHGWPCAGSFCHAARL